MVVHNEQPNLTALIAAADHAVLGGITCSSGQLKVLGCTDYLPDAFTLPTLAGRYGVAFLSFGVGTIDPVAGLEGDDSYALHLWSAAAPPEPTVLKQWKGA